MADSISGSNKRQRTSLASDPQFHTPLAYTYLYELLFGQSETGKRRLMKERMASSILKHRLLLHQALTKLKIRRHCQAQQDLLPSPLRMQADSRRLFPRYVFVNTVVSPLDAVTATFTADGFTRVAPPSTAPPGAGTTQPSDSMQPRTFYLDPHIPNMLVFAPGTDLHDHSLLRPSGPSGGHSAIILMDKASAMPAACLQPPPGCMMIDACAAPGNKTSACAILMHNQGKIFAFDADKRRAAGLKRTAEQRDLSCIDASCCDFLKVDPRDPRYAGVTHVLVDPSCSSSGVGTCLETALHNAGIAAPPGMRKQATAPSSAPARQSDKGKDSEGEGDASAETDGADDGVGEEEQEKVEEEGNGAAPDRSDEVDDEFGGAPVGLPAFDSDAPPPQPANATDGSGEGKRSKGFGKRGAQAARADPSDTAAEEAATHAARIESLARFQEAVLRHALSFPAVTRVVYSTCSVERRENEDVVARILAPGSPLAARFDVVPALPEWPRRGLPPAEGRVGDQLDEERARRCVRCLFPDDRTIGFFVALFERKPAQGDSALLAATAQAVPAAPHKNKKKKGTEKQETVSAAKEDEQISSKRRDEPPSCSPAPPPAAPLAGVPSLMALIARPLPHTSASPSPITEPRASIGSVSSGLDVGQSQRKRGQEQRDLAELRMRSKKGREEGGARKSA